MVISIDRLSGGNTPADGSDPRTFPAIWNATATLLEANVGTGGGSITVSATAPVSPAPANGDLWWDSTNGEMYVYYDDGTSSQWVAAAGPSVTVASVAPTGYEGQLWLDDTDGSMYVYYTDPGGGSSSWIGAVSRSGGILQVVSTTKTDAFTAASVASGSTATVTGLSASITPASASNKVLVFLEINGSTTTADHGWSAIVYRGATALQVGDASGSRTRVTAGGVGTTGHAVTNTMIMLLDSPATTSSTTYTVDLLCHTGGAQNLFVNRSNLDDNSTGGARSASRITLMEVAG